MSENQAATPVQNNPQPRPPGPERHGSTTDTEFLEPGKEVRTIEGGIYIVLLTNPVNANTNYSWNIFFAQTTTHGILCKQQASTLAEVEYNHRLTNDNSFLTAYQILSRPLNHDQMVEVINVVRQVECGSSIPGETWVQNTLLRLMSRGLIPKFVPMEDEPGMEDIHIIRERIIPKMIGLGYYCTTNGISRLGRRKYVVG